MARRTNDLTEFAKPVADDLAERTGSLKRVLSAGVLAFADLTPEQREYYMAKSIGKDLPESVSDKPETMTECIELVKHFVRYKIPSAQEQRVLESLRQLLADDSAAREAAEKTKHKKGRQIRKGAG